MTISEAEEAILDRIRFENPWWVTFKPDDEYSGMERRPMFGSFFGLITKGDVHRSVILIGPRRVGKTVMMQQAIAGLIANGVDPGKIAFVSVENPIYSALTPESIFALIRKAAGNSSTTGWYILLDEIQYMRDWELHLKILTDNFKSVKFIVSGSSAASLQLKSRESGAGRFTDFYLPALGFYEFIFLRKKNHLISDGEEVTYGGLTHIYETAQIKELNREFLAYINFGGYPEAVLSESIAGNPERFIRNDIIDKVLLRDLPSLYGIEDIQELNRLFGTLAYNSGGEISYQSISNNSGIPKKTLQKYLAYLESAFLISIVHRIDDNARSFKRADYFKIYMTNPSIRSAIFSPVDFSDTAMGGQTETALFTQWLFKKKSVPVYARWTKGRFQGEVDMIGLRQDTFGAAWAAEVKWSNGYYESPEKLNSLLAFCSKNKLKSALVTTIDIIGVKEMQGITLNFIPASLYAYSINRQMVDNY